MTPDHTLESLNRLVGTWTTEATHPMVPGAIVHGSAVMEWLEGERFLLLRARTDHPAFPHSLSVIGHMEHDRIDDASGGIPSSEASSLSMQYFDSRGVFRIYQASIDSTSWRWWRDAPGFSQRFTGVFADDGTTIVGRSQLRRDDVHWADDLAITYRRKER